MKKADLIAIIARQSNLDKATAEKLLATVLSSIVEAVAQGDKVEIRGFGSFRPRYRNSRVGRNPKSGEQVEVPPKRVPFFKAGEDFKRKVNDGSGGDTF